MLNLKEKKQTLLSFGLEISNSASLPCTVFFLPETSTCCHCLCISHVSEMAESAENLQIAFISLAVWASNSSPVLLRSIFCLCHPSLVLLAVIFDRELFVRNIPSYGFLCIPNLLQVISLYKAMWRFSLIYLSRPWNHASRQVMTVCVSGEGMCGWHLSQRGGSPRASHKDIINIVS